MIQFQSSPGAGAGRTRPSVRQFCKGLGVSILARRWRRAHLTRPRGPAWTAVSFNPRPALAPGAPPRPGEDRACPGGFNPRPALAPGAPLHVSPRSCPAPSRFNPRPALAPGALDDRGTWIVQRFRFNPRPALAPGAPLRDARTHARRQARVSILARRWRRAHRAHKGVYHRLSPKFQSSPGAGAGRTPVRPKQRPEP